jgi:hypothetical protein
MACPTCGAELFSEDAQFCTKCGHALYAREAGVSRVSRVLRLLALPFIVIVRAVAYPIRKQRERIRSLQEATGPDSPINRVLGLSDGARRVYSYLADINPIHASEP